LAQTVRRTALKRDPLIRSQVLYPAELSVRTVKDRHGGSELTPD